MTAEIKNLNKLFLKYYIFYTKPYLLIHLRLRETEVNYNTSI